MVERLKPKATPEPAQRTRRQPKAPKHPKDGPLTIIVNPNWRLWYDSVQWHIEERKVRKEGKTAGQEVWVNRAYVSQSLDAAICWLARHNIWTIPGTYDFEALEKLCGALDAIKAEVSRVLAQAVPLIQAGAITNGTTRNKASA